MFKKETSMSKIVLALIACAALTACGVPFVPLV